MSEMSCFKNEKGDSCCAHNSIGENVFETLPSYILNSKKYALEFENVHRQGFFQRNIVADLLITKGNHFFNAGLMEEAIVYLEKALSVLLFVIYIHRDYAKNSQEKRVILKEYIPGDSQEKNVLQKQKLTIFNILLFCYLELQKYHDAYFACEESLKIDPHQNQVLYFKQLISFIDGKDHQKLENSIIAELKSNYLLLDEKVKKFVQTKFQSVVDKFNSIEESIKEAIAYKEEEFENNYQLPTTVSEVKAKKHDPQIIHSQQFLMKLPFWVSAIVVGMIVSTYFF